MSMIHKNIKQLVKYGLKNHLLEKEDEIFTINQLLELFQLDEMEDVEAPEAELFKIAGVSENTVYKIGAFILLNEQDEAERLLNTLSLEEKEEFMSFPIFKFYTKVNDDLTGDE